MLEQVLVVATHKPAPLNNSQVLDEKSRKTSGDQT